MQLPEAKAPTAENAKASGWGALDGAIGAGVASVAVLLLDPDYVTQLLEAGDVSKALIPVLVPAVTAFTAGFRDYVRGA